MDTAIYPVFDKDPFKSFSVKNIDLIKFKILARYLADAFKRNCTAINKIVNYDNLFSCLKKLNYCMRTDKSRSARN